MFASDAANTSRIKNCEQGGQEIILPEHGSNGKICGVQSVRSPWDHPEETPGKYLLVWEMCLFSTHKRESIGSIHNVGKREVKG